MSQQQQRERQEFLATSRLHVDTINVVKSLINYQSQQSIVFLSTELVDLVVKRSLKN